MSNQVVTSIEGEHFLYRTLWQVVVRQVEHAEANPKGAFYDHLVAMVFAFHTLEAYLNHVGQKLDPDTWKDERNFFRKEPYRGFDGKVRKVLDLVGIPEPLRDQKPYSSIWVLKDLRDLIAHAKTERIEATYHHRADQMAPFHTPYLTKSVAASASALVWQDVHDFIETVHRHARPLVTDVWFGSEALEGPISHSGGGTRLA